MDGWHRKNEACGPSGWCFMQLEWKRIGEDWEDGAVVFPTTRLYSYSEHGAISTLIFECSEGRREDILIAGGKGKWITNWRSDFQTYMGREASKGVGHQNSVGKKRSSHSLSTCCKIRVWSHTKTVKAPNYMTIWWVAIRRVLSLVNVNPFSEFQKAVLCSMFGAELQCYRIEKNGFSVCSEGMVE